MNKYTNNKGITLVTLIITIIVLLILAVVAINTVQNEGIIAYAKNAQQGYKSSVKDEQDVLSNYISYLEVNGEVGKWKQETDENGVDILTNGEITLNVGDKVAYSQGEGHISNYAGKQYTNDNDTTWRILGIDKYNRVELISSDPQIISLSLANNDEEYLNCENILNNLSNDMYGKGNKAVSARSLNINDVEELIGLDEEKKIEKFKSTYKYGTVYYYKYIPEEGKVKISTDGENYNIDTGLSECKFSANEIINQNNIGPKIITLNAYVYEIKNDETKTWRDGTNAGKFIRCGEKSSQTIFQWLASKSIKGHSSAIETKGKSAGSIYEISGTHNGVSCCTINYLDNGASKGGTMNLRPVVTLEADTNFTYNEETQTWNIN